MFRHKMNAFGRKYRRAHLQRREYAVRTLSRMLAWGLHSAFVSTCLTATGCPQPRGPECGAGKKLPGADPDATGAVADAAVALVGAVLTLASALVPAVALIRVAGERTGDPRISATSYLI